MKNKILSIFAMGALVAACECASDSDQALNVESAAPGTSGDFKANIKDRVFFGFNKNHVTEEAHKVLESQAGWFKTYPNTKANVSGHCDKRGTEAYNLALGERRAHAAQAVLVKLGVHKDRLETVSYGKNKPLAEGDSEEIYAQNRAAVTEVK